jgi:putative heme-binding domain-containing protein
MMSSRSRFAMAGICLLMALAWRGNAQLVAQDHPGQYSAQDVEAGARVYNGQCAQCHGPNGDQVTGVDLRRGVFRRASSDEDLAGVITKGTPTGMPPVALQPAELTGIIAYIRAGFDRTATAVKLGDAGRGRTVFLAKGECTKCHRVNGVGSRTAPDLSDIGLARNGSALYQALLDPSSVMMPINRPVRIVTKNGRTLSGRRLNEDTLTVQLIDDAERLHSISKSDIKSYAVETKSTMPSYTARLTQDELADVVAYLVSLKGQL